MAKHYWSPSTRGFYLDEMHGPRTLMVEDPNFVPPAQPARAPGEEPAPPPEIPLVEVENPDTKIPDDAIEITAEEKEALQLGQSGSKDIAGKEIALVDGKPGLVDPPAPSADVAMANLRSTRDQVLRKTQDLVDRHRDQKDACGKTSLTDAEFAALQQRRQQLRDLPTTTKDPWADHLKLLEELRS